MEITGGYVAITVGHGDDSRTAESLKHTIWLNHGGARRDLANRRNSANLGQRQATGQPSAGGPT